MSEPVQDDNPLSRLKRRASLSSSRRDTYFSSKREKNPSSTVETVSIPQPTKTSEAIKPSTSKSGWLGHFNFAPIYDDDEFHSINAANRKRRGQLQHQLSNPPNINDLEVSLTISNHASSRTPDILNDNYSTKNIEVVPNVNSGPSITSEKAVCSNGSDEEQLLRRIILAPGSAAAAIGAKIIIPSSFSGNFGPLSSASASPDSLSSSTFPPNPTQTALFIENSVYLKPACATLNQEHESYLITSPLSSSFSPPSLFSMNEDSYSHTPLHLMTHTNGYPPHRFIPPSFPSSSSLSTSSSSPYASSPSKAWYPIPMALTSFPGEGLNSSLFPQLLSPLFSNLSGRMGGELGGGDLLREGLKARGVAGGGGKRDSSSLYPPLHPLGDQLDVFLKDWVGQISSGPSTTLTR